MNDNGASRPAATEAAAALRLATRTWRRAGVRPADRRELRADLAAELAGAADAGMGSKVVLGADPAATVLLLARENDLAGQSLRLGPFLAAALLGALIGAAPVLLLLGAEFSTGTGTSWDSPFLYYPTSGVLGFALTLVLVGATLQHFGDAHVRRTLRVLVVALPVTVVTSAVGGVVTAAGYDFRTTPPVFLATSAVVVAIYVLGCVAARLIATRPHLPRATSSSPAPTASEQGS